MAHARVGPGRYLLSTPRGQHMKLAWTMHGLSQYHIEHRAVG
jgi:hypothetical protein